MATACLRGLPDFISLLIFDDIVFALEPRFNGMLNPVVTFYPIIQQLQQKETPRATRGAS